MSGMIITCDYKYKPKLQDFMGHAWLNSDFLWSLFYHSNVYKTEMLLNKNSDAFMNLYDFKGPMIYRIMNQIR